MRYGWKEAATVVTTATSPTQASFETAGNILQISCLSKRFSGIQAIQDITLDLHTGLITSLVGPNGAGKTTLFNTITGHIKPDNGTVLFEGHSLVGLPPWKIARMGVMRTFQDLRLFMHMSVEDNVLAAMEPRSWFWQPGGRQANKARREQAAGFLAGSLSYAERKFLSLARIMATNARLWLLDEPAAGLDPPSYELFQRLLRSQVQRGISVCIIEHNLDIITAISDRIAFLDRGRVIAEGTPSKILEDPKLIAIYFGGGQS
jgi:branched-chain amino acid transport system ATP-binding protein